MLTKRAALQQGIAELSKNNKLHKKIKAKIQSKNKIIVEQYEEKMRKAAENLNFEKAIDTIF